MSLASRLAGRLVGLPPALTRDVTLRRDLVVRARDGVALMTDHYAPAIPGAPTVLIRTPYGRRGPFGLFNGRILAERGFHVVLQSCRGTFDSGGSFHPMRHERDDGLDTLDWIERQPWHNGTVFTYGPSYIGFTQWAIAADAGDRLAGMLTAVTASSFRAPTYAGGSFSLDTVLNWATLVNNQGGSLLAFAYRQMRSAPRLRRAWAHLPLSQIDRLGTGVEVEFFQEWLRAADDEPYWSDRGDPSRVEDVVAPVTMVGGWQDIFLPWQIADYECLRGAGRKARLVIGPWTHASRGLFNASIREGVSFFRSLAGAPIAARPVRLYVEGAGEWREYDEYPPPGRTAEWFAGPGGALTATGPASPASAIVGSFRYDPADPTPSPGGPLLTGQAGPRDNRAVESRADVLVFTSHELTEPFEALGPVRASVCARTSSDHFDIYVRVCDVHPDGRSLNVCDGLIRVDPRERAGGVACAPDPDGLRVIPVAMWPAGHRFERGHRIRVQISGAAHPRYARHTGTDEPLGEASKLQPIDYEVRSGTAVTMWQPA